MRFLLKVNIPVESGNAAAKAGKLGATIQSILEDLKPEAVYFTDNDGQRAGFMIGFMMMPGVTCILKLNSVVPAGSVQTSNETLSLQVSGAFRSEDDILNVNAGGQDRSLAIDKDAKILADDGKPLAALVEGDLAGGDRAWLGWEREFELPFC